MSDTLQPGLPESQQEAHPRAAYVLGYDSFAIWREYQEYCRQPDVWSRLSGAFPGALESLLQSRLALAGVLSPNVFNGMPPLVEDLFRQGEELGPGPVDDAAAKATAQHIQRLRAKLAFKSQEQGQAPGIGHWRDLRILLDRGLDPRSRLGRWYTFGVKLGGYRLGLYDPGFEVPRISIGTGQEPDFSPVLNAASELPEEDRARIPALESMVGLAPSLEARGQESYFAEYIRDNAWLQASASQGIPIATPSGLADALDIYLREELTKLYEQSSKPDVDAARPVWEKAKYELSWNGGSIKTVRPIADHVIAVLDAFEAAKWETRIPDPLPDVPDQVGSQRLNDTVKSLNFKLTMIRFHADGTGRGITWEALHLPETSCDLPL